MKNLILTTLFIVGATVSFSQKKCKKVNLFKHFEKEISITKLGGDRGYAIYLKGNLANKIENYYKLNDQSRKHTFKINNVAIPNIDETFKIKLHQGYHGYDSTNGYFYFHTYDKGIHTQKVVTNFSQHQKEGIVIYFKPKKGKNLTKEQADIITKFYTELK